MGTYQSLSVAIWQTVGFDSFAYSSIYGGAAIGAAVIIVCLLGSPAHHDLWDPNPETSEMIRGELSSIGTTVPGVPIRELFTQLAGLVDRQLSAGGLWKWKFLLRGSLAPGDVRHDRRITDMGRDADVPRRFFQGSAAQRCVAHWEIPENLRDSPENPRDNTALREVPPSSVRFLQPGELLPVRAVFRGIAVYKHKDPGALSWRRRLASGVLRTAKRPGQVQVYHQVMERE